MKNEGTIEIRVEGEVDGEKLSPDNLDINSIADSFQIIQDLLYPRERTDRRPKITYNLTDGSARHVFGVQLQKEIEFGAILNAMEKGNFSVSDLDEKTALAFDKMQKSAKKMGWKYEITSGKQKIVIDKSSNFSRPEKIWADAEIFIYGVIEDWGGKAKANIHVSSDEFGYLCIKTDKQFIRSQSENLVYKTVGLRCKGRQDAHFGTLDQKSLQLIELMEYDPVVDDEYLANCISNAKESWEGVDTKQWLRDIRGYEND